MKKQYILKIIFDFIVSLAAIVLLFPLFLIIAVLIKIESRGPVFFIHERAGKNGRAFKPFKFRTMEDKSIERGLGYNIFEKDERITRTGNFLRKWGIDEFPQLINVLKGEMSLVGPRPMFLHQAKKYNDFQKKRLLVKPGIVGWALIHGRNSLSWEQRIKYDVFYIENWSFWLDIKIIFKTFYMILIKQEGVYGKGGVNNDPFV